MEPKPVTPEPRSVFRWIAGVTCPLFVFAAIVKAFPQMVGGNGKPSFLLAALLFWGGVLFASIAATGKLKSLTDHKRGRSAQKGAIEVHHVAL